MFCPIKYMSSQPYTDNPLHLFGQEGGQIRLFMKDELPTYFEGWAPIITNFFWFGAMPKGSQFAVYLGKRNTKSNLEEALDYVLSD